MGSLVALLKLAEIFHQVTTPESTENDVIPVPPGFEPLEQNQVFPATVTFAPTATLTAAVNPINVAATLPRVEVVPLREAASLDLHDRVAPAPVPRVAQNEAAEEEWTYIGRTGNGPKRRRKAKKAEALAQTATALKEQTAINDAPLPSKPPRRLIVKTKKSTKTIKAAPAVKTQSTRRVVDAKETVDPTIPALVQREAPIDSPHYTRSRNRRRGAKVVAKIGASANLLVLEELQNQWQANAVVDPITGNLEEYSQLITKPNGAEWIQGMANEFGRLTKGVLPNMKSGTETMRFIAHSDMPKNKTATYMRIVTAEKPNKAKSKRVRCTVGGDRIYFFKVGQQLLCWGIGRRNVIAAHAGIGWILILPKSEGEFDDGVLIGHTFPSQVHKRALDKRKDFISSLEQRYLQRGEFFTATAVQRPARLIHELDVPWISR